MHTKLFAVAATVGMVLFALGPGVATVAADTTGNDGLGVAVSQAGNTAVTVTVTDNATAVPNATVAVEALDNGTYAGIGTYATGPNGTVGLPAPAAPVTIELTATADNVTGVTTAELTAETEPAIGGFGARVSAFVQSLFDGSPEDDDIGRQIADFVTQNNPGNAPDHAGPPGDRGNGPDSAGPPGDDAARGNAPDDAGPPEDRGNAADDAGPPGDDAAGEDTETEDGTRGNAPADAGPPGDDPDDSTDIETETEDDETETEDDETETEDDETETEDDETETEDDETETEDDETETEDDSPGGPPSNPGNGNGNARGR